MGLLDYYKQFEGMSDEEVSAQLRARAEERRRLALAKVEPLDLSRTTWHEMPHPEVVSAVTYATRRGINRAPDAAAAELREAIGRRTGLEPDRVAVGSGVSGVLDAAAAALLSPGDELLTVWPGYPLHPALAARHGAAAVAVDALDADALLAAVTPRTRLLLLANPCDPTGARLEAAALGALAGALPDAVTPVVDEALVDFVDAEPADATLALLDDHPRLVLVRSLSKAYGLAGLRAGWALGGEQTPPLLGRMMPPGGLADPVAAGALEALRACGPQVAARRAQVVVERRRILDALHDLPADASPSQTNALWLGAAGLTAPELAARLGRSGVIVAQGTDLGDSGRVRITVQSAQATDRLLEALRQALG
jgi:histidinol-phosphate aminotransferase